MQEKCLEKEGAVPVANKEDENSSHGFFFKNGMTVAVSKQLAAELLV